MEEKLNFILGKIGSMDKVVEYYKKDFWRRIKILFFDIFERTKLSSEMQKEDSWWDQRNLKEVRSFF
jgi:peptidyl-prolyl cis-trans isomerase SurA